MGTKTIGQLDAITTLTSTDEFELEQGGLSKKVTLENFGSYINPVSYRNKLINGNMDFWQRGTAVTSITAATVYQADRWANIIAGVSSSTVYSRQTFTPGQTDVPNNPKYYMRHVITSGGDATNGNNSIRQAIEGVETLAGKSCVISFYAKADAAKNITVELGQNYGTSGSTATFIASTKIAIGTTWTKYSIPFTVASISGKTIGTDSDYLGLYIWMSAGSANNTRSGTLGIQTGTFDFAQFQLEEGIVATSFEEWPSQVELALCQRYCYVLGNGAENVYAHISGGQCYAATTALCMITTPTMRKKDPTLTRTTASGFGLYNATAAIVAATDVSLNQVSAHRVAIAVTVAAGLVAGNATIFLINNSVTALILLDAEF